MLQRGYDKSRRLVSIIQGTQVLNLYFNKFVFILVEPEAKRILSTTRFGEKVLN